MQVGGEIQDNEAPSPMESTDEENSGVKFPGSSLEAMLEFKIDDVEISS